MSPLNSWAQSALTPDELRQGVARGLEKVDEFRSIKAEAEKRNLSVYLFGGTASSYLHYVKWDLERQRGDQKFLETRFDYDFTNIYRSTQDLDIVVDGNSAQIYEFQSLLAQKFPHFLGSKSKWEVRSLRESSGTPGQPGYKEALLNDFDFNHQNSDSNSTGLIELTDFHPLHRIRDLRSWEKFDSTFLMDALQNKISFYRSKDHFKTSRAKAGQNPEIFSVIRYLTKAFQYELKIPADEEAQIREIIQAFKPSAIDESEAKRRLIDIGKKLFKHAVNIEYAWNSLEKWGLRKKLMAFDSLQAEESLAWWMNKEPLRSRPLGTGHGKTAKELGLDLVSHETNSLLAFESITRSQSGVPNILISRQNAVGESAAYGDGFYAAAGRQGARGNGLTIRFRVSPEAREGTDFINVGSSDYYVFLNKNALRFIDEQILMTPLEYFQFLATGKNFDSTDRGLLEKFKRRLRQEFALADVREIDFWLQSLKASPPKNIKLVLSEYLDLTKAKADLELVKALTLAGNVQLSWDHYMQVFVIPEFHTADQNRKYEMFWDVLKSVSSPSQFLISSLDYDPANDLYSSISEMRIWLHEQNPMEVINFIFDKFTKNEKLDKLIHSREMLIEYFLQSQKTTKHYEEFYSRIDKLGIYANVKQTFELRLIPKFASMSESEKWTTLLTYYRNRDLTNRGRNRELLEFIKSGLLLPEFSGRPMASELNRWLRAQEPLDLAIKVTQHLNQFSWGSAAYDHTDQAGEGTEGKIHYSRPDQAGGLLAYAVYSLASDANHPMNKLKPFLKLHFDDLKLLKFDSIPALNTLEGDRKRDMKEYRVNSYERMQMVTGFFSTLAGLAEAHKNSNEKFERIVNTYVELLELSRQPEKFHNRNGNFFEWTGGYQTYNLSRDEQILSFYTKKIDAILYNSELSEALVDQLLEEQTRLGIRSPEYKSGKEFLTSLRKIRSTEFPRLVKIRSGIYTYLMHHRATIQNLDFLYAFVIGVNYAVKALTMVAPNALGFTTNFSEVAMFIDSVVILHLSHAVVKAWKPTQNFSERLGTRLYQIATKSLRTKENQILDVAKFTQRTLRERPAATCQQVFLFAQ